MFLNNVTFEEKGIPIESRKAIRETILDQIPSKLEARIYQNAMSLVGFSPRDSQTIFRMICPQSTLHLLPKFFRFWKQFQSHAKI